MPPRRQTFSAAELAALVAQGVADALAAQELLRNNGGDNGTHNTPPAKPCSYKDFLSCKPLYFKGTEGAIGLIRWIERMESVFNLCNCTEDNRVKFAAYTFQEGVLTWWNTHVSSVGIEASNQIPWTDLKEMLREEYCPNEELQKLEEEFWNLKVQGADIAGYTTKFQQLALLCPSMVDPEHKRIKRYIRGLPENLQGNVASSNPTTIQSVIRLSHELMAMIVSREASTTSLINKRKFDGNPDRQIQTNKRPATGKAYTPVASDKKEYTGTKPFCSKCNRHHDGLCGIPCDKCKRYGHLTKDCRTKACYECGDTGHFRNDCPKLKRDNSARGRAYVLNAGNAQHDPNTDTGMFILN